MRPNVIWTLAITSIALFMVVLDNLVVSTALPVIRVDLGATLEQLEWTVNAYTLTFAAFLLTGAALGDRFGRRRIFATGVGLFTIASAGAALAPSVDTLILARAVQGLGAAMVMPLTLTILSSAFAPERRGIALGIWGAVGGVGVAAGPLVGGLVIEGLAWQWIFWLNVPVGIALLPFLRIRIPESYGPDRALDLRGLALVTPGLLGLVWGLINGNGHGWGSPEIVGALASGVALVAAFVAWELRAAEPMLPMGFFRDRAFAAGNAAALLMNFGMFGALFLLTQFFQT
ncbi:MAG TPA: MFS transporter, partial [Solirubrobacteraceae bacterium]|nr:MFS transporter [Solirubrobacteraceae bacterium]